MAKTKIPWLWIGAGAVAVFTAYELLKGSGGAPTTGGGSAGSTAANSGGNVTPTQSTGQSGLLSGATPSNTAPSGGVAPVVSVTDRCILQLCAGYLFGAAMLLTILGVEVAARFTVASE